MISWVDSSASQVGYLPFDFKNSRWSSRWDWKWQVAPFDRPAFLARLRELSAEVLSSADEPDVVRFRDNNGIVVEVRSVTG